MDFFPILKFTLLMSVQFEKKKKEETKATDTIQTVLRYYSQKKKWRLIKRYRRKIYRVGSVIIYVKLAKDF